MRFFHCLCAVFFAAGWLGFSRAETCPITGSSTSASLDPRVTSLCFGGCPSVLDQETQIYVTRGRVGVGEMIVDVQNNTVRFFNGSSVLARFTDSRLFFGGTDAIPVDTAPGSYLLMTQPSNQPYNDIWTIHEQSEFISPTNPSNRVFVEKVSLDDLSGLRFREGGAEFIILSDQETIIAGKPSVAMIKANKGAAVITDRRIAIEEISHRPSQLQCTSTDPVAPTNTLKITYYEGESSVNGLYNPSDQRVRYLDVSSKICRVLGSGEPGIYIGTGGVKSVEFDPCPAVGSGTTEIGVTGYYTNDCTGSSTGLLHTVLGVPNDSGSTYACIVAS